MTNGGPNIIGPVGGLIGLGVMAYAAKGVIDVLKDEVEKDKKRKKKAMYKEPDSITPKFEGDIIGRGLGRMLK
jgi:hypothetical protein